MVAIALSLLAIKINIALEINVNSSSSAVRGEGNSNFKTLSKFYQYLKNTFHFKLADQLLCNSRYPERKGEKTFTWQQGNSKEKERLEENEEQMKRQVEDIRELKNERRHLLVKFKKFFTFKMP